MANLIDLFAQGGFAMRPLAGMSFGMLVWIVKRSLFWFKLSKKQHQVARDVLDAARSDMGKAAAIAEQAQSLPIGRFILEPLKLRQPTPETFHLALAAAADKEFVAMRKGNRVLEMIATVAPLFGLLGLAIAIYNAFNNAEVTTSGVNFTSNFMHGIANGLIPLAASIQVEIIALTAHRLFGTFQAGQVEYFSEVGNKLELYYREFWQAAQRDELLKASADNKYLFTKNN